jgi:hypothetical protein
MLLCLAVVKINRHLLIHTSGVNYKGKGYKGVGATGAMSFALISSLQTNRNQTFLQILASTRYATASRGLSQIPQLSAGHPMDMNTVFRI